MIQLGGLVILMSSINLRPHQALGYRTPAEVFHGDQTVREEESKDRRCSD